MPGDTLEWKIIKKSSTEARMLFLEEIFFIKNKQQQKKGIKINPGLVY